jgi:hypothetical protein
MLELWRQNGITSTKDRVANICTILQGDSLTRFEEKLQVLITSTSKDRETEVLDTTDKTVSASLNDIAKMVCPFRALETQNNGYNVACKSPRNFQSKRLWPLSEGSITVFHSSQRARKWTNSLPERS